MAIISFDKDAIVDYVVDFGDNRDDKNPCIVGLSFVSNGRVMEYAKQLTAQVAAKSKGVRPEKIASVQGEIALKIQKKQFKDNVSYVKNFSVIGKDGKANPCTDVGDFYENADSEIVTDIIRAMENASKLTEGQIKN
jgi:hypothetical protein